MARTPAKTTARASSRKAPAAAAPKRAYTRRAPVRTAAVRTAAAASTPAAAEAVGAPGSADLAGGLRGLLGSIDAEVRAVSTLSEQIDATVAALNDLRDQQAKRLEVLDALRGSVEDTNIGAFLDKAIRPRKTRVSEVVPERLTRP